MQARIYARPPAQSKNNFVRYIFHITMATASLLTTELSSFNNAIFSAINIISHILKQRANNKRVLNEIKKRHEFKDITKEYLQNH